jgi:hypothetical protein
MTDRIVQTTWTDGGRHQPLPPPEDPQGDEIERLTARIAELEENQERLIGWLVEASQIPCTELWTFKGWRVSAGACDSAIRKALETPGSGERRGGE